MIEELRRYGALAASLCMAVLFSVVVFVVFLQIDMDRTRNTFSAATAASAINGQSHLERLFDHAIGLTVSGTSNEMLIGLLRNAGLLTLVTQVCERSGDTTRNILQAKGATDKKSCMAERGEPLILPIPLENLDTSASLHVYQGPSDAHAHARAHAEPAGAVTRGPSLVLDVLRAPGIHVLFEVNLDKLIDEFRPSHFQKERIGGQYCLSLESGGDLLSLACKGLEMSHSVSVENYAISAEQAGDDSVAFIVRGIGWQLMATAHNRDIATSLSATPFIALAVTILLCGLICWFVFHAVDKSVKLGQRHREQEVLVDRLEQQNEDLDQFATMAAHDLQAPLRFVVSSAYMLEEEIEERRLPNLKEYSSDIVHHGERMRELILDLLVFCRAGQEKWHLEDVDVRHVIDVQIKELVEHDEQPAPMFTVGELPSSLRCDERMFALIIRNLLSNAIKFSRDSNSPQVNIYSSRTDDVRSWLFCVSDNGCGIDPAYHRSVFRPFMQLDSRKGGTGVGMAIVKKLVERHQGAIWIDPTVTEGTTVLFSLPEHPAELTL